MRVRSSVLPSIFGAHLALLGAAPAQETAPTTGTITGRVVDALGDGVAAVDVVARGAGDAIGARTRSDGDGMFVLGRVPFAERSWSIEASAPDRCGRPDLVRLSARAPTGHAELRLWDAGTIRATVVDPDGAPVADAHVAASYDLSRLFGFDAQAEARTGEGGTVTLEHVPLGWIDVRAWKDGDPLAARQVWLRDALDVGLALETGDGVTLDVRIEGVPDGATATVSVIPYDGGSARAFPAVLRHGDATGGRWLRRGLPAVEYLVRPRLDRFTFAPAEVRLETSAAHELTFRATPTAQVRVHGVLRDASGAPLAGETLACRHFSSSVRGAAVTDADGRFDVECPVPAGEVAVLQLVDSAHVISQPKGPDTIGSHDARFRAYHEFVVDSAVELDVRAAPSARIRGRVVDGDGRPARNRRLQLQEAQPNRTPLWMALASVTTDREGRFEFRGVNPPERDLRVSPGEIGAGATEPFTLQFGSTVDDLELVVAGTGIVDGVVRDADGAPIPGARVWLRNHDAATGRQTSGAVFEVIADRNGRFRHVDVEPGGHLLTVMTDRYLPQAAQSDVFEVEPGARVTRELRVER